MNATERSARSVVRAASERGGTVDWVGFFAAGAEKYQWKAFVMNDGCGQMGIGVVEPILPSGEENEFFSLLSLKLETSPRRDVLGWIVEGTWSSKEGVLFSSFDPQANGQFPLAVDQILAITGSLDWFCKFNSEELNGGEQ